MGPCDNRNCSSRSGGQKYIFDRYRTTRSMIDISRFEAIIFDLGGVILNIDYHATIRAFLSLGVSDFEERYTQAAQTTLFDDIETGRISPEEFRNGIRGFIESELSDDQIDGAWNAMLLDFPKIRIDILERVQKSHRTFLLSNTNEIHVAQFYQELKREHGLKSLNPLFEKVHLSHEMGLRKPNPEIFQALIDEHGLNPEKTLFIDDSEQHLVGAQQAELITHHLQPNETIEELIMLQAS